MPKEADELSHAWPTQDGPWEITYRLGWVAGRPACVGLAIGCLDGAEQEPLRSTELRRLAHGFSGVGSVLAEALDAMGSESPSGATPPATAEYLKAHVVQRLRPDGRSVHDPEHHHRVVSVYLAGGSAPTRAVQEEFGVSYSTARSWVAAARRLGLLASSGRGRVSGLADDQTSDSTDEEQG